MTSVTITEGTGGLSNQVRRETLTQALRICLNQLHTSAMKKNIEDNGKICDFDCIQELGSGGMSSPTQPAAYTTELVEIITEKYTGVPPDFQFRPTTTSPSVAVTPDGEEEEVCTLNITSLKHVSFSQGSSKLLNFRCRAAYRMVM